MKNFLTCVFILICNLCLANGGPFDDRAILDAGNLVPINVKEIELLGENLEISIIRDFTSVNVQYYFKNNSEKTTIKYGFPVDFTDSYNNYTEDVRDSWYDDYVTDYSIKINGEEIEFIEVFDEFVKKDTFDVNSMSNFPVVQEARKWYFSDITFESKKIVKIEVSYKIINSYMDSGISTYFIDDYSYREFNYDFSPAQNWGDGSIDFLTIIIDTQFLDRMGEKITISGINNFNNFEGLHLKQLNNINLSEINKLNVKYTASYKLEEFLSRRRILDKDKVVVKASSNLGPKYTPDKLFDNDFSTAWSEGVESNGIGEWIEIEFSDLNIGAIYLCNGYLKNQSTYYNNSRIKTIEYEVDIEDYRNKIINIPDLEYNNNKINFLKNSVLLLDCGMTGDKIGKIRFRILDVYLGDKFEDTCVTEILIFNVPDY